MEKVRHVSKEELLILLKENSVKVVNVLAKQAYENLHIAGSIWIPFDRLEGDGWKELLGSTVVTYCASSECGASETAASLLLSHGIHAMAYRGGIKEWAEAGFPVEGRLAPESYGDAGKC